MIREWPKGLVSGIILGPFFTALSTRAAHLDRVVLQERDESGGLSASILLQT